MAEQPQPDLGALVEGRSDEEINQFVKAQGVETILGQIFNGMASAFAPDQAAGQSAVVQYDVTAEDGAHSYQLKVADGKCEVVKGAAEPARITLGLAMPDFLRLISGKLDGMQAFMSGKLRIAGDMMFAQTMQSWFRRPS
jgi:putative sterol carrier protein